MVTGGAGTGKTHTLFAKIFDLHEQHISPCKILLLARNKKHQNQLITFSNKTFTSNSIPAEVTTFYSLGLKLIHSNHIKLGYCSRPRLKPSTKLSAKQRKHRNVLTLDDVLTLATEVVSADDDVYNLDSIRAVDYLLVDDAQELHEKEIQLIAALSHCDKLTIITANSAQHICYYRNPSSTALNSLIASQCTATFHLKKSYRVPEASLPLVNAITENTKARITSKVVGNKPSLLKFDTPDDQADFVAKQITLLLRSGVPQNEIVVLSSHRTPLEQFKLALDIRNIPTKEDYSSKELSFWIRCLKSLICLVKWTASNNTLSTPIHSIKRILKLVLFGQNRELLVERISQHGIKALKVPTTKKQRSRYEHLNAIRNGIIQAATVDIEVGTRQLIYALMPYVKMRSKCKNYIHRELSHFKLKCGSGKWNDLKISSIKHDLSESGIELSTIHNAIGREWSYVFLIYSIQELFMTPNSKEQDSNLLYVAATRHNKQLYFLKTPRWKRAYTQDGVQIPKKENTDLFAINTNLHCIEDEGIVGN